MEILFYLIALVALAYPLGIYMAWVLEGKWTTPLETFVYKLSGVTAEEEQDWKGYTVGMLLFNLFGFVTVYLLQRLQATLPLNPEHLAAVAPHSAFNTAVSFASNTNWQNYGGETTLSYLVQMLALTVQNFVSAATGIAVLAAFIRGLARHQARGLGSFWVDLTRTTLYILLPLSLLYSLILVQQGTVQTLAPYQKVALVEKLTDSEGKVVDEQVVAVGPAASQVAIKQLGTNGGGFFNVNSAHPLENPTPVTNFLECLAILLIPAALCLTFGRMVGDIRQGWAVLAAMMVLFLPLVGLAVKAESQVPPALAALGVEGGNMEGKEVRFGTAASALWAVATTVASNGSVNSMHDSYTPLGGLAPLFSMLLGEVVFGGVGSGLYGMLIFAIVAVFVAGLMVGRTPEYLGKKIEAYEIKMCSLFILIMPIVVLGCTALAVTTEAGRASVFNAGPHGFSEVLYGFSSMGNNNGSAFAGLGANVPFYNYWGGIAMLLARYWLAIPVLAMAGALVAKKRVPPGAGTLPTHDPLFIGWLVMVVIIVGALAFLPALALGPLVEHLLMLEKVWF